MKDDTFELCGIATMSSGQLVLRQFHAIDSKMLRRPGLVTGLGGFGCAALAVFWLASWGRASVLGWVIICLVVAFIGLTVDAVSPRLSGRRVAVVVTLLAAEVLVLWGAVVGGRMFFAWQVRNRLGEYQIVADSLLSGVSGQPRPEVKKERPHPDLARATAKTFEDGSSLVELTFEHAPRHINLLLVTGHRLPRLDRQGRCLERLAGNWHWYRPCQQ